MSFNMATSFMILSSFMGSVKSLLIVFIALIYLVDLCNAFRTSPNAPMKDVKIIINEDSLVSVYYYLPFPTTLKIS